MVATGEPPASAYRRVARQCVSSCSSAARRNISTAHTERLLRNKAAHSIPHPEQASATTAHLAGCVSPLRQLRNHRQRRHLSAAHSRQGGSLFDGGSAPIEFRATAQIRSNTPTACGAPVQNLYCAVSSHRTAPILRYEVPCRVGLPLSKLPTAQADCRCRISISTHRHCAS